MGNTYNLAMAQYKAHLVHRTHKRGNLSRKNASEAYVAWRRWYFHEKGV